MISCIVFDSPHMGNIWDWLESILIVMDHELWYDPTLGHSHLREFLSSMRPFFLIHRIRVYLFWLGVDFFRWPLWQGILLLADDGFLSHSHPSEEIRRHFSHWSMRHDWYISSGVLYTRAYFSVDDGFWGIVVPWSWLDSFHIGVWDLTECFD